MASKPVSAPVSEVLQAELGSPYCSDPNCQSCKDLREAQQDVKAESDGGIIALGKTGVSRPLLFRPSPRKRAAHQT